MRIDLAACYRLADMHGMSKVIWNHITARVPDEPDAILLFRLGCRYDEVTASNLVKVDVDANPRLSQAFNILSIPTIAFFKPGEPPQGVVGFKPLEQLEQQFGLAQFAVAAAD